MHIIIMYIVYNMSDRLKLLVKKNIVKLEVLQVTVVYRCKKFYLRLFYKNKTHTHTLSYIKALKCKSLSCECIIWIMFVPLSRNAEYRVPLYRATQITSKPIIIIIICLI